MKRLVLFVASFITAGAALLAQAPDVTISWKSAGEGPDSDGIYTISLIGEIADGWHTYSLSDKVAPTTIVLETPEGYEVTAGPYEMQAPVELNGDLVFSGKIVIGLRLRLTAAEARIKGSIEWQSCNETTCAMPEEWEFSIALSAPAKTTTVQKGQDTAIPDPDKEEIAEHSTAIEDPTIEPLAEESPARTGDSLLALIVEAILWGFAMLLTPCVFPMVPMTISFFMKGSSSAAGGRFKASMYGLFIVLLYTVPICLIIGLTWIVGGDTVTADIFNWLATHWLPNIIFFLVFLVFALSFFGAFEITLPSSIVNRSDKNSDKKGLAGVFFMALTLVLVSFSCTGPIVGSVLIKSTRGEFWAPMVTMLAFSIAFALPFTILAFFPALLQKMKKGSGSWLNSVKVVLGFIEVALGLKFLSVPDQTYHWGLLDREVYLAIWIVVFSLMGIYLLGKLRLTHDEPVEKIGVSRLILAIAVFSFVVYLIPGMFGAPLKALSGYLPPIETQDFVIPARSGGVTAVPLAEAAAAEEDGNAYELTLPLGLSGYFTLEEGLAAGKAADKPVFVDITGHGCTNCREMEQRVWSNPRVLELLRNEFVITALYTDDKTRLAEEDWVTAENGKVLKDLGRANSYMVRKRFGVNAQPNYAILSPDGQLLVPIRGYNLDVDAYVDFLRSGIDAYKASE